MTARWTLAIGMALLLGGCATFGERHQRFISPAMEMQADAISDPRFAEILTELDAEGSIVWENRLTDAADAEADLYSSRIGWLLAKYDEAGGLPSSKLRAWRKWNPFSRTTAAYNPSNGEVSLNLWRFTADEFALLNTFVHEQNHSFGLIHDASQTRINNMCDAGYLAGDLAEAILRTSSSESGSSTPHTPVCPALRAALERRSMWFTQTTVSE
ncbi:hypothetical protein [Aurantiacibacter gangjinensis]|uniref:hypothetical protein n=1 Tax=Aurantiacibacter gangjinensis TaxID=502682 RepID=UPI000A709B11|nr:hypothetical protein [Aurantiacibacter gangjinensis]